MDSISEYFQWPSSIFRMVMLVLFYSVGYWRGRKSKA